MLIGKRCPRAVREVMVMSSSAGSLQVCTITSAVRLLAGRDPSTVLAASMLMVGAGYAGSVLVWTLVEIGIAVMFGATFADLAPADLRGRYMGVASATWSVGAVFGPLLGSVLLDHAGRETLGAACAITGIALFAGRQALGPALRQRAVAQADGQS
ncbi:hypothetical protein [Spongiactinospora sp. 9N601]|uniref:hypothetical protein n=1 Tax=Spongiactinospora sp. 9N601 TaxID=3375149 RepID=UPI0037C922F9